MAVRVCLTALLLPSVLFLNFLTHAAQLAKVALGLYAVSHLIMLVRTLRESERQVLPFALVLDVYFLSNAEGVFKLDTEISDGTVYFRMTEEKLHCAQVACLAINLRSLRPSQ